MKTITYTDAQTAEIVEGYTSGVSVQELAARLGKTTKSVIAKLSQMKVYVPAKTTSRVTKDMLIASIAAKVGLPADKLEQLAKADRTTLALLMDSIS